MKKLILTITLTAITVTAQLYGDPSRIGCFIGGGTGKFDEIKKLAAKSADNPERKRISAQAFGKDCAQQLTDMYGYREDGTLFQKKKYIGMETHITKTETSTPSKVRIIQTTGDGVSLASSSYIKRGDTFAIRLGKLVADGFEFYSYLKNTGEIYSYTTVLGALKNIAVYDFVLVPIDATPDQLQESFDSGVCFSVLLPKEYVCPVCNGVGTIPEKKGTFTVRKKCATCTGTRRVNLPTLYSISR